MGIGTLRRHYPENQPKAEPDGGFEFTKAAKEAIEEAGLKLEDYDGEATGKTGNVLKDDATAWVEAKQAEIEAAKAAEEAAQKAAEATEGENGSEGTDETPEDDSGDAGGEEPDSEENPGEGE